jgi:hypothetical protein
MRHPFQRRRPAISRRDAERLLDREPPLDASHLPVADLLAAAAGPALPAELADERTAVGQYQQAYRVLTPAPGRHRFRRRLGLAVTATAAVLLVGGTAYATGSGRLPEPLQRAAHDWLSGAGVPAPAPSPTAHPQASVRVRPNPEPSLVAPTGDPALIGLCRSWQAFQADPHAGPVTGDERRRLADAAGGEQQIDDFCQRLLSPGAAPTTSSGKPGNPSPGNPNPGGHKPSHPPKPTHG